MADLSWRRLGSAMAVPLAAVLVMAPGLGGPAAVARASQRVDQVSSPAVSTIPVVAPEDASTPVPAPITVSQCRGQAASRGLDGWQRDAFSWCRSYGTYVQKILNPTDGLEEGRIEYNLVMVATGSRSGRTAKVRVYFDIVDVQDPANLLDLPNGTISVDMRCDPFPAAATCQPSSGPDTRTVAQWMAASADDAWPTGTGNSRWSAPFVLDTSGIPATSPAGTSPPEYVSNGVYYPVITFTNSHVTPVTTSVNIGTGSLVTVTSDPNADPGANMRGSVRFDSAQYLNPNGGARLGHVDASGNMELPIPVLHYSVAPGSPDNAVARHLYIALNYPDSTYPDFTNIGIHKIFPGVPGRELTRIDPSLAQANRTYSTAICDRLWGTGYTAGGNQCDEYPFATTQQGGSNAGFDISVCPLNGTENGNAGIELGNFYLDNRILIGDKFTVTIDSPPAVGSNPAATLPCTPPTNSTFIVINVPRGGSFYVRWSALGGSTGALGDPVSNYYGITGGQEQDFQAGSIYWSAATGTDAVDGPIYTTYQQMGGATSHLGFPTDEPYSYNGGQREDFQNGYILSGGTGVPGVYYTASLPGSPLVLRSNANGDYVTAEIGYGGASYGMLRARAASQGTQESWTEVPLDNGMIALQNDANGLYASTEVGYTGSDYAELRARASVIGPFEQYKIVNNADGTYSLQSQENGQYVSAELGYTGANYGELRARASSIGSWEEFTPLSVPIGCTNYGALMTGPNGCTGFTTGGPWFSGGGTGWLGKEIWTYGNGTVQDSTATYQLSGLNNTVVWQLQAYIPDNHSDASNAHYHYCAPGGGCADGYINQNWYTNQWVTFGSTCTSDGTVTIVLADDGGDVYPAQVGADAIRAVRTNLGC